MTMKVGIAGIEIAIGVEEGLVHWVMLAGEASEKVRGQGKG